MSGISATQTTFLRSNCNLLFASSWLTDGHSRRCHESSVRCRSTSLGNCVMVGSWQAVCVSSSWSGHKYDRLSVKQQVLLTCSVALGAFFNLVCCLALIFFFLIVSEVQLNASSYSSSRAYNVTGCSCSGSWYLRLLFASPDSLNLHEVLGLSKSLHV